VTKIKTDNATCFVSDTACCEGECASRVRVVALFVSSRWRDAQRCKRNTTSNVDFVYCDNAQICTELGAFFVFVCFVVCLYGIDCNCVFLRCKLRWGEEEDQVRVENQRVAWCCLLLNEGNREILDHAL